MSTASSQAFVLDFNASNQARKWSLATPSPSVPTNSVNRTTKAIRYFIASDGYSTTNSAAELNAVRASFGQWQSIPGTHLKFEEGGLVAPGIGINTSDTTNVVYWTKTTTMVNGGSSDFSGALGVAFSSFFSDNTMDQADIVLNGNLYSWATDFTNIASSSHFVEGVLLHEIGHLIGLIHSPVGTATMLSRGGAGISAQVGLSSDEVAAARSLYPSNGLAGSFGAVRGQVTKSGSPVFGAAVFAESATGNIVAGTVTLATGNYQLPFLPSGNYQIRVAPLDPNAGARLVSGPDISSSFGSADIGFLPTTNIPVTISAGVTNTLNAQVVNSTPAFRITS
ncbi:MAG: carboxypeptidase regulatory-like domain-containing protein, partial [Opitutaceae bacterium]|nr:carboxypeptidase regulatory-like domain-containing protein [Verrucomicrobiales bacterium]